MAVSAAADATPRDSVNSISGWEGYSGPHIKTETLPGPVSTRLHQELSEIQVRTNP